MKKHFILMIVLALIFTLLFSSLVIAGPKAAVKYYDATGNRVYGCGMYYDSANCPVFGNGCYYYDSDGNQVYVGGCYIYYYDNDGNLVQGSCYYDSNGNPVLPNPPANGFGRGKCCGRRG